MRFQNPIVIRSNLKKENDCLSPINFQEVCLPLCRALLVITIALISNCSFGQIQDTLFSSSKLKKLSLEELMNIEVTSISMRPEKLTEVASAVQVITREDIHRSGAVRLPETLRLASNLQVGQANSNNWAVTAPGI